MLMRTLTGEQMQIRNELMTADEMRLGLFQTRKTGRNAFKDGASKLRGTCSVTTYTVGETTATLAAIAGTSNKAPVVGDYIQDVGVVKSINTAGTSATLQAPLGTVAVTGATPKNIYQASHEHEMPGLMTRKGGIDEDTTRLLASHSTGGLLRTSEGIKLIVPLSFFFTQHVSQYFPLAAVAGCNDVSMSLEPIENVAFSIIANPSSSTNW